MGVTNLRLSDLNAITVTDAHRQVLYVLHSGTTRRPPWREKLMALLFNPGCSIASSAWEL